MSQAKRTIEEVARQIEAGVKAGPEAFDVALESVWNEDGVVISHEPAMPADGASIPRAMVHQAHAVTTKAFLAAMPDFRFDGFRAKISGDVLEVSFQQHGTLSDGTRLDGAFAARMTIEGGLLRKMVGITNPEQMAPFMKIAIEAMQAQGLPVAAE